jgi:molybdopterin converting factor small subunit
MVHVKVKIFHRAMPEKVELELEEGNTVETLLLRIKEEITSEREMAAFLGNAASLVVLLNGMTIFASHGWKTLLREGDEISLLPMVAGG